VQSVKPITPQPVHDEYNVKIKQIEMPTNVHDVAEADWVDQTTITETFDEQCEGKSTPSSNEIACALPEEDSDTTSNNTSNWSTD
jgi:hypothetical protein